MNTLSATEDYVLSTLNHLKNNADQQNAANFLLGFYAINLREILENFNQYILTKKLKSLQEEKKFIEIIGKLTSLKFLKIKRKEIFENFIRNNICVNGDINFLKNSLEIAELISLLKQKLSSFFEEKESASYELRIFWPSSVFPEVYDLDGLFFKKKYYIHEVESDKYILTPHAKTNIKLRKKKLHIKTECSSFNNIYRFDKKQKIHFPIKGSTVNNLFSEKITDESILLQTPAELLLHLSHFSKISCIDIIKDRFVRQIGEHTKIELSQITLGKKEWKTICLQSNSFRNILALSLLINTQYGEKLSYAQFLHKYGLQT